jgi:hypothetical protein
VDVWFLENLKKTITSNMKNTKTIWIHECVDFLRSEPFSASDIRLARVGYDTSLDDGHSRRDWEWSPFVVFSFHCNPDTDYGVVNVGRVGYQGPEKQ